jgi:hypothetical protein
MVRKSMPGSGLAPMCVYSTYCKYVVAVPINILKEV